MTEQYESISRSELIWKIKRLQKKVLDLKEKNRSFKKLKTTLKASETRYRRIFQDSQVALLEGDFSAVLQILRELPCNSPAEYSDYLNEHKDIVNELIKKIRITDINDTAIRISGARNKRHLLLFLNHSLIPESIESLKEAFIVLASGSRHYYECETMFRRIDGSILHVLLTANLTKGGEGSALIGMMDISERILHEQERERLLIITENQRKIAEVLRDVTLALTSKINRADILDTILEQTHRIIPYASANIRLLEGNRLVVVRWSGYENFGAKAFIKEFAEEMGKLALARKVINNNSVVIIPDTKQEPIWVTFPETAYIRSFIAVPIAWRDRVIGLFSLDGDRKDAFTHEDAEKLLPIASAAAVALQNSMLFERANREINDRKETEKNLMQSLGEKDDLLKEIHHRVKNNLATIIALINLQSNRISDPSMLHLFEDLRQRVFAISLVHEKLYESHDLSSIDFYTYVNDLLETTRSILSYQYNIEFQLDIPEGLYFEIDTLIPLGLILNELITNSLKYAFPERGGEVRIKIERINNELVLMVKDTGVGFPEKGEEGPSHHLGLNLVESLAMQIGGSAVFRNDDGAVAVIRFTHSTDSPTADFS